MKKIFYLNIIICVFILSGGCASLNTHKKNTFTVFDIETTGLSPSKERIIEIGAVKFSFDGVAEYRSWLINPGIDIPKIATRVHGITDDMVADAPSFKIIYKKFKRFAGDTTLIAHNARFDMRFIAKEADRCGMSPPHNYIIDSLRLFRTWFPYEKSYSLESLTKSLGIKTSQLHRGLEDAEAVRKIINKGIKEDINKQELIRLSEGSHWAILKFK